MSSIVLATSSAAFDQKVRRAFGFDMDGSVQRIHTEGMFLDPNIATKLLAVDGPDIIAIGPNVPVDLALDVAKAIEDEHPEIAVVLVAAATPDIWEGALHAGVRDVLSPDATEEQVRALFGRLLETSERRRRNLAADVGAPDFAGRVITVVAPKGGVGKTALATNLAVTLAKNVEGRVVLVDLDLQFGDVGSSLGLEPENTIADLARIPGGVTATSLKVFLTPRNENLYALCAPMNPAEEVPEAVVEKVVRLLAEEFEYVVIDTSAGLSEATLGAIDLSTDLLFLCDLSASALRGLRKVIDALDSLEETQQTRHFVVNRADGAVGITPEDASVIVGRKVNVEIPTSQDVPLAMNFGNAVVEESPQSPVALGFASVAAIFADVETEQRRGFSLRRNR